MTNTEPMDRKVLLTTLWIFAMFNSIYADVYTLFFNPVLQKALMQKLAEGFAGSIPITQGFVLLTAVLIETAIAMVILSRVLKYGANRWANIISGAFHTLFVFWSLIGDPVRWKWRAPCSSSGWQSGGNRQSNPLSDRTNRDVESPDGARRLSTRPCRRGDDLPAGVYRAIPLSRFPFRARANASASARSSSFGLPLFRPPNSLRKLFVL